MFPVKFDKYGTPVKAGSIVIIDIRLPDEGIAQFQRIRVEVFETTKGLAYNYNDDVYWLMDVSTKLWHVEIPHSTCISCKYFEWRGPSENIPNCNKRQNEKNSLFIGLLYIQDPNSSYCGYHEQKPPTQ